MQAAEIYQFEVMNNMSKVLGALIKKYREKKGSGFTQQWLANTCKLSMSYVSQIEQGRHDPSIKTLAKICKALGVPLWKLIKEIEKELAKESE